MKNLIILLISLILNQFVLAQQSQQTNPYTKQSNKIYDKIQIDLPLVDHNQLLEQDLSRNPGAPFKYGHKHLVNYSPDNSGKWEETTTGGRLWHITFKSKNAFALSIDFEQFYIPKGGELYIYNSNYDTILGAYTYLNNSNTSQFSTPLIEGDIITLEYYEPANTNEKISFTITEIIHDYRDIMNFSNDNRDWECGINVICETDEVYQGPINSVAFLDMGGFICSGAMINNVRQDLTPYFLTAWHCINGENPNTFRFYFNKQASSCENTWGSAGEYAYGSDLLSHSNGISNGDWALLLINDDIEEDWEVYYSGWDMTGDYPLISSGVHHPGGTPKKINYDNDIAYGAWWDNATDGLTHWQVNWDSGGSEGGSSGSPIFNDRFRIVGVLTGGSGGCGEGWPDLYGKLSLGWNWELPNNQRLIDWLDPDYTGNLIIDGTYEAITSLSGDLNGDNNINILDIIQLANMILSENYSLEADLNNDGNLNILDIISLANIILEL